MTSHGAVLAILGPDPQGLAALVLGLGGYLHVAFEHVLGLFPVGGQEVMIFLNAHGVGFRPEIGVCPRDFRGSDPFFGLHFK